MNERYIPLKSPASVTRSRLYIVHSPSLSNFDKISEEEKMEVRAR